MSRIALSSTRGSSDTATIDLAWLVRLRWAAVIGQTATVVLVERALGVRLDAAALFAVIAVEAATNIAGVLWLRAGRRVPEALLAAVLAVDVVILTVLLHLSGGPFNPFSVLYLIPISVGSLVLRERWTWALMALGLAGSALLFVAPHELALPATSHAEHMRIHLQGMWIAFGVCAAFLVYFLIRLRRARDAAVEAARSLATRQEKLGALTTLAAGAAHELSTPLATIAVVVRELERSLDAGSPAAEDAATIRSEVARCRAILDRMSVEAGEPAGEALARFTVGDLVGGLAAERGDARPLARDLDPDARDAWIEAPQKALTQALHALVRNARDASDAATGATPVEVAARPTSTGVAIEVLDRGVGMPTDVLARVGEPFFTTKAPGRGMGLGVFLARTVVERVGGTLELLPRAGGGTVARVALPTATPPTNERVAPRS